MIEMMCGVRKLPCVVRVCMIWLQQRHNSAIKMLVDEMYTKRKICTWTSIELHDKYLSYGGQLTQKQMFTKMVMHLGDDVVVLCIEGCASKVGFREFVGKLLKFSKVNTVDEEKKPMPW